MNSLSLAGAVHFAVQAISFLAAFFSFFLLGFHMYFAFTIANEKKNHFKLLNTLSDDGQ
jgi:hypothetical protein